MKVVGILGIFLMVIAFVVPMAAYLTITAPADAGYNKKFASHEVMAYDQSTFEGMKEQILFLWKNMNETWQGENLAEVYSSWWYPLQTYDESLQAEADYFRTTITRLDNYIVQYENLKADKSTSPIYIQDWYDSAIKNFRSETSRAGGLCWAIEPAYYLTKQPMAYWLWWWVIPLAFIIGFIGLVVVAVEYCDY